MFDIVLSWLKSAYDWFAWLFTECWRQFCNLAWSVWSVVLVVVGMVSAFFDFLGVLVGQVVDALDTIILPSFDLSCGGARYYLELANTFLPVSEFFVFLIAYAILLGLLLLYKGVKSLKSWIWAS